MIHQLNGMPLGRRLRSVNSEFHAAMRAKKLQMLHYVLKRKPYPSRTSYKDIFDFLGRNRDN